MAKTKKETETKKRRSFGSICQRSKHCFEAQYRYNGTRHSFTTTTEAEAEKRLDKIEAEINEERHRTGSNMPLIEWLEYWLETYVLTTVKIGTYNSYKKMCENHIIPALGRVTLGNLNVDRIQKFFNEKAISGRLDGKEGGLSLKTLRNMRNMMHESFNQAITLEKMAYNPISGLKLQKLKKREMRFLSYDEQEAIENTVYASLKVNLLGIVIAMYMGMRLGELMGLQWHNIHLRSVNSYLDIERQLIRQKKAKKLDPKTTVIRDGGTTHLILTGLKTDSAERRLYIPSALVECFHAIRSWQQEMKTEFGAEFNSHDFVFCSELGDVYDPRTYTELFYKVCRSAGASGVNFHALRHTYASRALENGISVKTLQELMGHADIQTTLAYVHDTDELKIEAAEMVMGSRKTGARTRRGGSVGGTFGGICSGGPAFDNVAAGS